MVRSRDGSFKSGIPDDNYWLHIHVSSYQLQSER